MTFRAWPGHFAVCTRDVWRLGRFTDQKLHADDGENGRADGKSDREDDWENNAEKRRRFCRPSPATSIRPRRLPQFLVCKTCWRGNVLISVDAKLLSSENNENRTKKRRKIQHKETKTLKTKMRTKKPKINFFTGKNVMIKNDNV